MTSQPADQPFVAPGAGSQLDAMEMVSACFEAGTRNLLLDHGTLPPDFFDLSTGVAGELVQKLINYGIRAAVVVPDDEMHSQRFREFARESLRSGSFRVLPDRRSAVDWLAAGS